MCATSSSVLFVISTFARTTGSTARSGNSGASREAGRGRRTHRVEQLPDSLKDPWRIMDEQKVQRLGVVGLIIGVSERRES